MLYHHVACLCNIIAEILGLILRIMFGANFDLNINVSPSWCNYCCNCYQYCVVRGTGEQRHTADVTPPVLERTEPGILVLQDLRAPDHPVGAPLHAAVGEVLQHGPRHKLRGGGGRGRRGLRSVISVVHDDKVVSARRCTIETIGRALSCCCR